MGVKNINNPLPPNKQYKFDKEQTKPSNYNPTKEERAALSFIQRDWAVGENIKDRAYEEFNDVSLHERQNIDQRAWNNYVKPRSNDPDEAWKANTVRPVTRNKCISIAAHVTNTLLYPQIFAQNNDNQEDKDSAMVMGDLMEWSMEQSNYERNFLYSVISAMYNPATIIYEGYHEVTRKAKEMQADGSWIEGQMIDDEYSGFQLETVPVDELYIGDIYEHNIQKQPFLIWRRVIDFTQAAQKYNDNEKFKKYVRPGLRIMYVDEEDTFYEQYDDELEFRLVEEVHYWNKYEDLHLVICNGVLLTDPKNPNERMDKKYPFAKTGYELIDEGRFFYYKSLADKIQDDQRIVDVLYNMVIDGSFINLFPPSVVIGTEDIDTAVYTPGTITTFQPDTQFQTLPTNNNLAAGINAMNVVENSITESATSPSAAPAGSGVTAFEISRVEQNARTLLGLFGKMIGFLVKDLGELRLSTILQYMTVGEVDDLTSTSKKMRFRKILIQDQLQDAKKITKSIEFEPNLPTAPIPEEEAIKEEMEWLSEEGWDNDKQIIKVQPKLFRELKYKIRVIPDILTKPSGAINRALDLEMYDRAIQNPLANQEAVTRDFLFEPYKPGESVKYMKTAEEKKAEMAVQQGVAAEGTQQQATSKVIEQLVSPLGAEAEKAEASAMPDDYAQE